MTDKYKLTLVKTVHGTALAIKTSLGLVDSSIQYVYEMLEQLRDVR